MKKLSGIKLEVYHTGNTYLLHVEANKKLFEFQASTIQEILEECSHVFSASTIIEIEKYLRVYLV
jgi:hypothetical protein